MKEQYEKEIYILSQRPIDRLDAGKNNLVLLSL